MVENGVMELLSRMAPLIVSLVGAGGVYKVVEKLLDIADKNRERRDNREGATAKDLSDLAKELNDKLFENIQALAMAQAELIYCKKDNERLAAEKSQDREHYLNRIKELTEDLRQTHTTLDALMPIFYMIDDEVMEHLKAKIDKAKEGEVNDAV